MSDSTLSFFAGILFLVFHIVSLACTENNNRKKTNLEMQKINIFSSTRNDTETTQRRCITLVHIPFPYSILPLYTWCIIQCNPKDFSITVYSKEKKLSVADVTEMHVWVLMRGNSEYIIICSKYVRGYFITVHVCAGGISILVISKIITLCDRDSCNSLLRVTKCSSIIIRNVNKNDEGFD